MMPPSQVLRTIMPTIIAANIMPDMTTLLVALKVFFLLRMNVEVCASTLDTRKAMNDLVWSYLNIVPLKGWS